MTNEKVAADLRELTGEQLEELKSLVDSEATARGKWTKLNTMSESEWQQFYAEQIYLGDKRKNGAG